MKIVKSVSEMQSLVSSLKRKGYSIGFVPTMGALHEGHLSLVKKANRDCDEVVVSIFLNPTQFGPKEDFKRYPRVFAKDKALLEKENIDIIFYPTASDMYSKGFSTFVDVGELSKILCGKTRPNHFRGVATVVTKLFNIVKPNVAYFGQKDAQQVAVIKKMIREFNLDVLIKVIPTVREKDGLAMSSRNTYLNAEEKKRATSLYQALSLARGLIKKGMRDKGIIINRMKTFIKKTGSVKIDYVDIVKWESLDEIKTLKGKILIALAVWIGKTRLIDNIVLNVK